MKTLEIQHVPGENDKLYAALLDTDEATEYGSSLVFTCVGHKLLFFGKQNIQEFWNTLQRVQVSKPWTSITPVE